jgi:hypothetical protein
VLDLELLEVKNPTTLTILEREFKVQKQRLKLFHTTNIITNDTEVDLDSKALFPLTDIVALFTYNRMTPRRTSIFIDGKLRTQAKTRLCFEKTHGAANCFRVRLTRYLYMGKRLTT